MPNKNQSVTISKQRRLPRSEWLEHFCSWKASGQTQIAYCSSYNLSYHSFKKQYSRVKAVKRIAKPAREPFIPIQLTDSVESQCIELVFRSGVVMKIPTTVSLPLVFKSLETYL